METRYAIPAFVTTVKETDTEIHQVACMESESDAILYKDACIRHGAFASIPPFDPTSVGVIYKKDSDGKIGIPA